MPKTVQTEPITLREGALRLAKRLAKAGYQAFWVGGSVRDAQLGKAPKDYDIATDAKPEDIEQLFRKTIPVGKQFGVIMVLEAGHEYQVATFRAEADYTDGRRPGSVRFTDAREDALRRDFTVNTVADYRTRILNYYAHSTQVGCWGALPPLFFTRRGRAAAIPDEE